jgi:3-phenylpropionate/trans-cinnamate dioxygenase ferredoxin subunit
VRHVAAPLADIPPGGRRIVTIEGRSIGVFNVGGELFALRNACPHQGGPLCQGVLSGLAAPSAPGEYRYARRGEILRCPWHGWEFDVRTGRSSVDPEHTRVRSYPVSVEDGQVVVEVG